MAENITPVQLSVKGFESREVMMIDYAFSQATDREGQISGIPRGGRINIRVKAMNDGNNQLLQWMLSPNDPRDIKITFSNTIDGSTMKELRRNRLLLCALPRKMGGWRRALRRVADRLPRVEERSDRLPESLEINFRYVTRDGFTDLSAFPGKQNGLFIGESL